MITERTMQLINADIDGELSQAGQSELESMLESSAEARAMRAELLKLNNLMSSLPAQQPPPDLNQRIMQTIKLSRQKSPFAISQWFASFQPATAAWRLPLACFLPLVFTNYLQIAWIQAMPPAWLAPWSPARAVFQFC